MHCANCGTPLPQGAATCPTCGAVSPPLQASNNSPVDIPTIINTAVSSQSAKPSEGGAIYSWPTRPETPSASSPPQTPPTYYGSQPSYINGSNPYAGSASNPYRASYAAAPPSTETPPPPPSIRKRKKTTAFVTLLCLALLVLVGVGILVFVVLPGNQKTTGPTSQVTATQQSQPISPSAQQALYDRTVAKTPTINDPLSGADNFGWDNYTGANGKTRCFFSQGMLHALAQSGYFSPCYAKATNHKDFVLQVKMTLVSGHSGGLVFRADSTNDKGYQFRIGTDGNYILNRIILDQQGEVQSDGETLTSGSSTLVQQGTNQLAVIAQGNAITLFINGKYVDSATDSTYHSGQIGIYVDSDADSVEGAFSSLQVWKLT